jgi:hypothetical protein
VRPAELEAVAVVVDHGDLGAGTANVEWPFREGLDGSA